MSLIDKMLNRPSREQRAIDEYNLGLAAKYEGRWQESLAHNQRAAELRDDDEATWWNLAIAATALSDWTEARRGWIACGVAPDQSEGEVTTAPGWACVRLVPEGPAEVVWGERIDPARIVVKNVPLPGSERRYGDIILNDGAEEGTRVSNGREFPVFNELVVWRKSEYSTFALVVSGMTDEAKESLGRLCGKHGVEFEDWGTIRILCGECSRGNPGPHACVDRSEDSGSTRFGFASKTRAGLEAMLSEWGEIEPEIQFGESTLEVAGMGLMA